jgi:RHS repeat-associated protein
LRVIWIVYLSFFPTTEGYYDYENFRYIYQIKDHLGNVRISYVKDDIKGIKIMDKNDYYPFGMVFLKDENITPVYDPLAIPYNYKFQEQELQETGFYSFKWRQYMPDVGRFFNIDPLSEKYAYQSHYNFSENKVTSHRELEGLEAVSVNDPYTVLQQETYKWLDTAGQLINKAGQKLKDMLPKLEIISMVAIQTPLKPKPLFL